MKLVSTALLLGVLLTCCVTCSSQSTNSTKPRKFKHNSKVESVYDKAKDETTTYLRPMTIRITRGSIEAVIANEGKRIETIPSETVLLTAYFISPGKIVTKPSFVVIGLRFWALDKTTYGNDRKLVIRFDKSELDMGSMELMERRLDPNMEMFGGHNYFVESFELGVPVDTFVKVINAAKVALTLGRTELQLGNEHLEAFRDLNSRIQ